LGSHINDYVVEDHVDHVLGTFKTQHDAIESAKKNGHTPHVARVRHLSDKETNETRLAAVRTAPHTAKDLTKDPKRSIEDDGGGMGSVGY
jgi:hypothetical protein